MKKAKFGHGWKKKHLSRKKLNLLVNKTKENQGKNSKFHL